MSQQRQDAEPTAEAFEGAEAKEERLEDVASSPKGDVVEQPVVEQPVVEQSVVEQSDVEQSDERNDAERERDEYLDALRRLQAEFDNYRKRVARQQSELLERASEALLERLLPTLDALDLAAAHAKEPSEGGDGLAGAVGQISSLLRDTLSKEGLERIDAAEVDFDPNLHDAVVHDPADDTEHRVVVVEVLRPGYRLKGRTVRPAMVRVRG